MCTGNEGCDEGIDKIALPNSRETCDGGVIVSRTDGSVKVSHDHQDQRVADVSNDLIVLVHSVCS